MKKILNFFNKLGFIGSDLWHHVSRWSLVNKSLHGIGRFGIILKKLIFRESAATRKARIIRIIGVVIVILVVLGLVGWYLFNKFNDQESPSFIAKAKVYVISAQACGQKCWDANLFIEALKGRGIEVIKTKKAYSSWLPFSLGNRLIEKYKIEKVPTVVVELVGKNKPDINSFFNPELGEVIDGNFVLNKILTPYYDLGEKKIKGMIDVTILKDESCLECYDIGRHELALKNLGIYPKNIETIDISSDTGQELIDKYKITKIPTLIISGEVSEHQALSFVWDDLGIIADDGTYIFTNVDLMGDSYRDLSTGKIIKADIDKANLNSAP